jgi:hypothetical protein
VHEYAKLFLEHMQIPPEHTGKVIAVNPLFLGQQNANSGQFYGFSSRPGPFVECFASCSSLRPANQYC